MYVDESGDTGLIRSPSDYFILSGLVIHELRWQATLQQLIGFRKRMRALYGLKMDAELHASNMIHKPGQLSRIPKYDRLAIIRNFASEIGQLEDCNIINIVVDKRNKALDYDVFEKAWNALINRFENTIRSRNFPGPKNPDDKGLLFPDQTDNKKLTQLLRKMRYFNPTPNNRSMFTSGYRNLTISYVIEDPSFKDSRFSYFVQAVDTTAFLLHQSLKPNSYMKSKGGDKYFSRLAPVLCTVASASDPLGIVRL